MYCSCSGVETEACNNGPCPTWTDWSSWGDCSTNCDGGTQSRTRQCQNGQKGDCPGSETDEQQCNLQSCEPFVFWRYHQATGALSNWWKVEEELLPLENSIWHRCVSYCLSYTGCTGVEVWEDENPMGWNRLYDCYISDVELEAPYVQPWRDSDGIDFVYSAVPKSFYESNIQNFVLEPDYEVVGDARMDGLCDEINTDFGIVEYRRFEDIEFTVTHQRSTFHDSDSSNCASKCFETAGCSAFFVDDKGCTYIIGRVSPIENYAVTVSGMLHGSCPTNAFKNMYTKISEFYCVLRTSGGYQNLVDSILQENTGNPNTPLGVWSFENTALMTTSQYVSVSESSYPGLDSDYRVIQFSIETHMRIPSATTGDSDRKRESTDILAEMEAIEQKATDFILEGEMKMPEGVEVAATGLIVTVEFVQTTADGSIAADCSSGSCQCSVGFIDNGNGCEEMTLEQAATTQAPKTTTPEASWGNWISWTTCSRTCDNGTRTRLRACSDSTSCPGSAVETKTCNDGSCPAWSNWSSWNDCSVSCGDGIQSRTRQCQNGQEGDCPGSATTEQQCNRQSCKLAAFVYWTESSGQYSDQPREVDLPFGDNILERCLEYCVNTTTLCYGIEVWAYENQQDLSTKDLCYIIESDIFQYPFVEHWPANNGWTPTVAILEDHYHESKYYGLNMDHIIEGLYKPADGTFVSTNEIDGICEKANTGFGQVNFRKLDGMEIKSEYKYVIQAPDSTDCAATCFETAGCYAYFVDNRVGCNNVLGTPRGFIKNNAVTDSGMLHYGLCSVNAFTNTFTRRSEFYCLVQTPDEAQDLALSIVERNTGIPNSPIHVWSIKTINNNPLMTSSQYVSLSVPDMAGTESDRRLRLVRFSIETHVRIGESQSGRKRRSDDILAEIESIEQKAASFILEGEMKMPDGVEVLATSPVETVEFVQTAADGSIAADCSSGTCQCSTGFIDNGNGCEEMIVEPSAATQPATFVPPPALNADSITKFTQSLVHKMELVFEESRPGKPRTRLLKKWQNLSDKFLYRHTKMVDWHGCDFANHYENNSVDFNSVKTCKVCLIYRLNYLISMVKFNLRI